MRSGLFVIATMLVAACGGDKKGGGASDAESKALAAKAKETVSLPALGLSIDVPAGTTLSPPYRPEDANRTAHLEQGRFMINVFAVDDYSAQSFAKAKEVSKEDKLIDWISADETPTGWILFKEVDSSVQKRRSFEVDVRTYVGGRGWDCGVSAPTRGLAELALAACKTLR